MHAQYTCPSIMCDFGGQRSELNPPQNDSIPAYCEVAQVAAERPFALALPLRLRRLLSLWEVNIRSRVLDPSALLAGVAGLPLDRLAVYLACGISRLTRRLLLVRHSLSKNKVNWATHFCCLIRYFL